MIRSSLLPPLLLLVVVLLLLLASPSSSAQPNSSSASSSSNNNNNNNDHQEEMVVPKMTPPAPEPPIDRERELGILSRLIKSEIAPECTEKREDYFYRSLDGRCNWLHPGETEWGKAGTGLMRDNEQYSYKDGIGEPRDGPNARELSNIFFKRNEKIYFEHTSVLVGVVEFVIHDIITTSRSPTETISVPVPKCDPYFDKECEGNKNLTMWRSSKVPGTGTSFTNPRETLNNGTTWLDLSPIYGNSVEVNRKLRTMSGGKLLTQKGPDGGDYPPFNSMGLPMNAYKHQSEGRQLFAAGDPRSNQDWLLLAAHVLFMRNHNRFCDLLAEQHPDWDDEKLFQYARHLNIAHYSTALNSYMSAYFTDQMPFPKDDGFALFRQWYNETVLTMNPYHTYPWEKTMVRGKPLVASQELAIGYRFHDLIPEEIPLINEKGEVMEVKRVANTTFDASGFMEVGIDAVLRGMAFTTIPNFHSGVSEDYRSAWVSYAVPGEGFGYDMVAWTIIQERERGLPPFNEYFRRYPGKVPVKIREKFEDFSSNPYFVQELKRLYRTPDDVDFTVGLQLDEEYFPGTTVPRTQLITSLFSLFGVGTADRFCVAYSVTACLLAGKPWDCTPLNPVDEVLWEPIPNPIFPRARWGSVWFDELDITNGGMYGVWSLITKNSNVKCVQLEPLWPHDPETNPVVCSLPKSDNTLLFYGIYTFVIAVILYTTIKCCVRGDKSKKAGSTTTTTTTTMTKKTTEIEKAAQQKQQQKKKQQTNGAGALVHRK